MLESDRNAIATKGLLEKVTFRHSSVESLNLYPFSTQP